MRCKVSVCYCKKFLILLSRNETENAEGNIWTVIAGVRVKTVGEERNSWLCSTAAVHVTGVNKRT